MAPVGSGFAARLKAAGMFSQEERTRVLHDLMIWRTEMHKVEQVPLAEGRHAVRVNYLDGFVSRGWGSYLTCNGTPAPGAELLPPASSS